MPKFFAARLFVCLVVAFVPCSWSAADYIQIGNPSGSGNIVVSNASPLSYNIAVTTAGGGQSLMLDSVLLSINRVSAQQTVAPIIIDFYNALGAQSGTGSIIASTTIPASRVTAGASFVLVSSTFSSAVALPASGYSVRVSSTSSGSASDKYQIKQGVASLYTSGSTLISSYFWVEDSNGTGSAGTSLVASGTVLAQYTLGTNALRLGNYRVGTSLSGTTALVNSALVTSNTVTQALAVTGATNGGLTSLTGLPSPYLSVGGTSQLVAGLNGATTGPNSGTATLTFNSVPGTSLTTGTTAIEGGTLTVTGTGYDWANAKVSAATLAFGNVRTGSAAANQTVAIGNQTLVSGSFQDLLNVSGSTNNANVTLTGFSNLAASASGATTSNVSLAANTATAGSLASTVSLTYTSNANGVAGLTNGSATIVGGTAPGITTTGGVYDWANAVYTGTTFTFGYIHRGGAAASGTAAIGNQTVTSGSFQDTLNVSASTGNPLVTATGFNGLAASTGGSTTNNLVVSIGTGTAGSLASTLALALVSNANGVAGLSNGTATVVGSPGSITTTGTVFTGQSTWNVNGSGQWGTLASNFGTNWNWGTFDGSPGVDPGFTNTDTATFGSALTSGSATVTVTAATPSVKLVTFNNAAAAYSVAGASGGSLALLNAGTSAATVAVITGSHAMSLPVALGSNTDFDVASGSILSMSGILSGAKAVANIGSGTTVFSGNNTYSGATAVSAGMLLIHGNQSTATGAITVAGGATLGGRGTAGGAVTVLANGILAPGASVESLAVGATTFSSGSSIYAYEVDSSVVLGSGSAADLLVSNGNLSIGSGSILEFTDLAATPAAFPQGTKFSLISYGSNSWSGLFTYQGNELVNGETFSTGLNFWEIRYDDPVGGSNYTADQLSGNSVTITAVPEPATLVMLAAGAAALAAFGCRPTRRRSSPAT